MIYASYSELSEESIHPLASSECKFMCVPIFRSSSELTTYLWVFGINC